MSDLAIKVENLGKQYRIGGKQAGYRTFREAILDSFTAPIRWIRGERKTVETFWALEDVSFEVKQGEAVGIIGRNGAGKSTLLKILSRITKPTTGRIELYGRVASLLEVGTGFHPELSGRDNIYLNGAILGMTRREISRKLDEIVDFSGVEKFLDTPVKHYSSGMYVRLAFAVAANLESEILVIDEVLAVGDAEFQKKCLGKMGDITQLGRTVLFVSHNMGAITNLCSKGMLLYSGKKIYEGLVSSVINKYSTEGLSLSNREVVFQNNTKSEINIRKVAIKSLDKKDSEPLDIRDQVYIELYYDVTQNMKGTNIHIAVKKDGYPIFRSWDIDTHPNNYEMRVKGNYSSKIMWPKGMLPPGIYSLSVDVGRPGIGVIDKHDDCIFFEIVSLSEDITNNSTSRGGAIILNVIWDINRI